MMEIHASSTYNKAAFHALAKFSISHGHPTSFLVLFIVSNVIVLACLPLLFLAGDVVLPSICLGIVLLCDAFVCFARFGLPSINYKKISSHGEISVQFTFRDDDFSAYAETANAKQASTASYSLLKKIVETSAYFFLYNTKNTAFILSKAAVSEEDCKTLQNRFANAGVRFIQVKM